MTKYGPLENFLKNKSLENVPMSFSEIESIIGDELPPSARKHRAWWSNNPSNSVITYAWLAAGYKSTEVSLEGEQVVFRRSEPPSPGTSAENSGAAARHPFIGYLVGRIVIADGVDLTRPALPPEEWLEVGKKYDDWP